MRMLEAPIALSRKEELLPQQHIAQNGNSGRNYFVQSRGLLFAALNIYSL
jgi:hypothetical protein